VDPAPVLGATLRLGLDWRIGWVYLRAAGGPGIGETVADARAWEAVVAGGWSPARWLQVGPRLGVRLGSTQYNAVWTERVWFAGLESSQCGHDLFASLRLCVTESVSPFGRYTRRWVRAGSELVKAAENDLDFVRLAVGVTLQAPL